MLALSSQASIDSYQFIYKFIDNELTAESEYELKITAFKVLNTLAKFCFDNAGNVKVDKDYREVYKRGYELLSSAIEKMPSELDFELPKQANQIAKQSNLSIDVNRTTSQKRLTAGFLIAAGAVSIAACVTIIFAPHLLVAIGLAVGIGLLSTKIAAGIGIAAGLGAMFSGFGVLGLFGKREKNDRVEIVPAPKTEEQADTTRRLPGYISPFSTRV